MLKYQEMSIDAHALHLITLINILIFWGVPNRTCKSSPMLYFMPVCMYAAAWESLNEFSQNAILESWKSIDRFQFRLQPGSNAEHIT